MRRRVHLHVQGPSSHGCDSILQSPRCLGRERSLQLEASSEGVAPPLRPGRRSSTAAATAVRHPLQPLPFATVAILRSSRLLQQHPPPASAVAISFRRRRPLQPQSPVFSSSDV